MVLLYCHHLCHYFLNLRLPSVSVQFIHTLCWLWRNCYSSSLLSLHLYRGRGLGLWPQFLLLPSQNHLHCSPLHLHLVFSFLHMFSSRQAVWLWCFLGFLLLLSDAFCCSPTVELHWPLLSQLLLWSCLVIPCVCLLPELCNNDHSLRWCLVLLCVHCRGNFNKCIY